MLCKTCEMSAQKRAAVSGVCSNPSCRSMMTNGLSFYCPICSIERGACENCGDIFFPRRPGRVSALLRVPAVEPLEQSIREYFLGLDGVTRVDIGKNVVVTTTNKLEGRLPRYAFFRPVLYVAADETRHPDARFEVVFVFTTQSTIDARHHVLSCAWRWRGVETIEPLFPAARSEYAARFFVVAAENAGSAERIRANLESFCSVHHAHVQPTSG